MDNVIENRNKLKALLADTLTMPEYKRKKALEYFDRALMELSREVLEAELDELRELAYEKTDLEKEASSVM
jgi:hypothetical protein